MPNPKPSIPTQDLTIADRELYDQLESLMENYDIIIAKVLLDETPERRRFCHEGQQHMYTAKELAQLAIKQPKLID